MLDRLLDHKRRALRLLRRDLLRLDRRRVLRRECELCERHIVENNVKVERALD